VSNGPVAETVTVNGQTFPLASAGVIVGPPKFAPPSGDVLCY
jgi:hypothetical protein